MLKFWVWKFKILLCCIYIFQFFGCSDAAKQLVTKSGELEIEDNYTAWRNSNLVIKLFNSSSNQEIISLSNPQLGVATILNMAGEDVIEYVPDRDVHGQDSLKITYLDDGEKTIDITINIKPWSKPTVIGNGHDIHLKNNRADKTVVLWQNGNGIVSKQFINLSAWSVELPVFKAQEYESIYRINMTQNSLGEVVSAWQVIDKNNSDISRLQIGIFANSIWQTNTYPYFNENVNSNFEFTLAHNERMRGSLLWNSNGIIGSSFGVGEWTEPEIANAGDANDLLLIHDLNDNQMLVWRDGSGTELNWAYNNSEIWQIQQPISFDLDQNIKPVLAVNEKLNSAIIFAKKSVDESTFEIILQDIVFSQLHAPYIGIAQSIAQHSQPILELQATMSDEGHLVIGWIQKESDGTSAHIFRRFRDSTLSKTLTQNNLNEPENLRVVVNELGETVTAWTESNNIITRTLTDILHNPNTVSTEIPNDVELHVVSDKYGYVVMIWNNDNGDIVSSDLCIERTECRKSYVDHSQLEQECKICHDGVSAKGKNDLHIDSNDQCIGCHSTEGWRLYIEEHNTVQQNYSCLSCHDNQIWVGKNISHLSSSEQCESCHSFQKWFPVLSSMDHSQTDETCVNCHNSGIASGKAQLHPYTSSNCMACHDKTLKWLPVKKPFAHAETAAPCFDCHNTISTSKPSTHPLTSDFCEACHSALNWFLITLPFSHSETQDVCTKCHNDLIATGKPFSHPLTSDTCDGCHITDGWWQIIVPFSHDLTQDQCINCHNGVISTGKTGGHPFTTNICIECHITQSWFVYRIPFPHSQTQDACYSCHNGGIAVGNPGGAHPATTTCDVCHVTTSWLTLL